MKKLMSIKLRHELMYSPYSVLINGGFRWLKQKEGYQCYLWNAIHS
jgi:hypothetical protein